MAHIEPYASAPLPLTDVEALGVAMQFELDKLMNYLASMRDENPMPEYNAEPTRPHHGMLVIADGTNWDPGHGHGVYWYHDDLWHFIAAHSGTTIKTSTTTVVNTTTETEIYSAVVASEDLRVGDVVKFKCLGSYSNSSGSDDWVIRIKVNGVTTHTLTRSGGNKTDVGWDVAYTMTIRTIAASGSVVDHGRLIDDDAVYTAAEPTSHTVDTTADITLSATIQWNNAKAGNTFSCTQGFVERLH